MSAPSDTPRTDAAEVKATETCFDYTCTKFKPMVNADFARTLERENVIFLESATKAQIRARKIEIAAKEVVEARHMQGDRAWDRLKEAIAELEGLVRP